ncbi:MAG: hypothetical protein ACK55I_07775, partial [bacterium]
MTCRLNRRQHAPQVVAPSTAWQRRRRILQRKLITVHGRARCTDGHHPSVRAGRHSHRRPDVQCAGQYEA